MWTVLWWNKPMQSLVIFNVQIPHCWIVPFLQYPRFQAYTAVHLLQLASIRIFYRRIIFFNKNSLNKLYSPEQIFQRLPSQERLAYTHAWCKLVKASTSRCHGVPAASASRSLRVAAPGAAACCRCRCCCRRRRPPPPPPLRLVYTPDSGWLYLKRITFQT